MRKFIRNILLISLFFSLFLSILLLIRKVIVNNHSWKLPQGVHIVFLGASHVMNGVDDSLMKTAINWASSSERYMFTYIKLTHLFEENPELDTVFLELAPTDLWEDTDCKYHILNEQSHFVRNYWTFFERENWMVYDKEPLQVLKLVLSTSLAPKCLSQEGWWYTMGHFNKVRKTLDTLSVKPSLEVSSGSGREVNYKYLRKIIQLCRDNNVKLYFIETPTYKPEYFYNQEYFYSAYKHFFSDVEFFDYSKWPMDPSEMSDAHHLNYKGAIKFTNELKNRFRIE